MSEETKNVPLEDAKPAKAGKATQKNQEPTAEELKKAEGATAAYFDEQGEKSAQNLRNGGQEVTVSLTNTTKVRMLENHGFMKAGSLQEFSDVALAIHEKAGAKFEKL